MGASRHVFSTHGSSTAIIKQLLQHFATGCKLAAIPICAKLRHRRHLRLLFSPAKRSHPKPPFTLKTPSNAQKMRLFVPPAHIFFDETKPTTSTPALAALTYNDRISINKPLRRSCDA